MRCSLFLLFILSSCTYYNEYVPLEDCVPDSVTFIDSVQSIITDKCIGCHNESAGRPAILETYDGVIDAVNNNSLKYQVASGMMPPEGSDLLSESEINIIIRWVDCE